MMIFLRSITTSFEINLTQFWAQFYGYFPVLEICDSKMTQNNDLISLQQNAIFIRNTALTIYPNHMH